MVLDQLANAGLYRGMSGRMALALDALGDQGLLGSADGRYELDGDDVFALVQGYTTKGHEQGRWEAHRKYIDVQFMISGGEVMGWAVLAAMREVTAYDATKDVAFYGSTERGSLLKVDAGMFAIFWPQDVHMPSLAEEGGAGAIRKVVIKVRV